MSVTRSESSGDEKNEKSQDVNNELLTQLQAMQQEIKELKSKKVETGSGDLSEELIKALKAMGGNAPQGAQPDGYSYMDESQIDPDDFLKEEDAVRFYAHVSTYVIVDDKRQGMSVRTPYGNTIKFEYEASRSIGQGKNEEREHFCVYKCQSKKELEWLRAHTLYRTIFHESAEAALDSSTGRAQKVASIMTNLMAQDKHTLINTCLRNGIEMMESVDMMRTAIANKMVDEIIAKEKASSEKVIREQIIEEEILFDKK